MSKKWIVVLAALAVGTAGVMVTSPTTVVAQPMKDKDKDKDKAAPKAKKEPSEKQKAARATLKECSAKWKEHKKASGEKGMKAYLAFMRECRKAK